MKTLQKIREEHKNKNPSLLDQLLNKDIENEYEPSREEWELYLNGVKPHTEEMLIRILKEELDS